MNFYLIYAGLILAHLFGGMSPAPLWVLGPIVAIGGIAAVVKKLIRATDADRFDVFGETE